MQNSFNAFKNFCCKKGKCDNSCCKGWQIDVDKKTLEKYSALISSFDGVTADKDKAKIITKLKTCVDYKNGKMKMQKGVCPFLNSDGLCEIIIHFGKNYLSYICKHHPRFISEFSDRIECGYGLACEKATEMLFNLNEPLRIFKVQSKSGRLTDFEKHLLCERDNLIDFINANGINDIIDKIQSLTDFTIDGKTVKAFLTKLTELEITRPYWKTAINSCISAFLIDNYTLKIEKECDVFKKLLSFFLYRHTSNSADKLDFLSRVIFSLLSAIAVILLAETDNDLQNSAREYSVQVEYSDENLFTLLDFIEEQKFINACKK